MNFYSVYQGNTVQVRTQSNVTEGVLQSVTEKGDLMLNHCTTTNFGDSAQSINKTKIAKADDLISVISTNGSTAATKSQSWWLIC